MVHPGPVFPEKIGPPDQNSMENWSIVGPIFPENFGPGDQNSMEFWSPGPKFSRTNFPVTALLSGVDCTYNILLEYIVHVFILANCPVFGGTSRFFRSSIELIFSSVPLLHEISPLCPAFLCSMYSTFYGVPPCPAKFNAASRFYHGSGWHVCVL